MTMNKSLSEDFLAGMIAAPLAPVVIAAAILPGLMIRTITLALLWGWYVVPTFGVPSLRWPVAFGLTLLVFYMQPAPKPDDRNLWQSWGFAISRGLFVLLVGWVGTWFL